MSNFASKKSNGIFRICFIFAAFLFKPSSANATSYESVDSIKLISDNKSFSPLSKASLWESKVNPNFFSFRVERLKFENNKNLAKTHNILYFSNNLEPQMEEFKSLRFRLGENVSSDMRFQISEFERNFRLLESAKGYYSENGQNYVKFYDSYHSTFNNLILNNTVPIYLGRSCENATSTIVNLNSFCNPTINKNNQYLFETSLNTNYDQSEWNSLKFLNNSSSARISNLNNSNRFIKDLNFFPMDRFPFFPVLASSDFSFLLLKSYKPLCLSKHASRTNQFYDSLSKLEKSKLIKRKFSLRNIRVPTKRELRDSVVDSITVFFKFKKWTKDNVQRPLGNLIRNTTGNLLLNPPHFFPFQRKFGSIELTKKFSSSKIKYDLNESIAYRWIYYNKLSFLEGMKLEDFIASNKNSDFFYTPLPFNFETSDFKDTNNLFLKYRTKKEKNLIIGLNSKEILLPQSLTALTQRGISKELLTESQIFDLVKSYDKEYLNERNEKAAKSIRYFINVSNIQEEIINSRKVFNDKKKLPSFFLGPELLSNLAPLENIPHTCGYGLGYFNISNKKIYINPTTGLLSIYKDSNNESFSGNDKTTFYGVKNGKGYYSDDSGIKYYYSHNYEFDFLRSKSNKDFPKSRLNPDSFTKEFYSNLTYLSNKEKSGPWVDVRRNVRHSDSKFYPISKNKVSETSKEIEIIEVDEY